MTGLAVFSAGDPAPLAPWPTRGFGGAARRRYHVLLVDTLGLLLHAIVHPADIQDRDGGVLLLATLFGMYPFLQTLFADAGYPGRQFHNAIEKILPHLQTQMSSAQITPWDLSYCPSAGSLSARWRGSIAAEGSPRA
jgi:DDE family transposase